MRFVPIKTAEQQAVLMLHRTRDLMVRQRTMLVNALRGHMAELGIIPPQGIARVADLIAVPTHDILCPAERSKLAKTPGSRRYHLFDFIHSHVRLYK
jgi:transposase